VAAGDDCHTFEIGEGAGDPHDSMIATRRQPQPFGRAHQQRPALGIGGGNLVEQRAVDLGIGADAMILGQIGIARRLAPAAAATRLATAALPSVGGGSAKSAAETAGTSMCRSMRSSNGPDKRP
jgi:hypothetical protein